MKCSKTTKQRKKRNFFSIEEEYKRWNLNFKRNRSHENVNCCATYTEVLWSEWERLGRSPLMWLERALSLARSRRRLASSCLGLRGSSSPITRSDLKLLISRLKKKMPLWWLESNISGNDMIHSKLYSAWVLNRKSLVSVDPYPVALYFLKIDLEWIKLHLPKLSYVMSARWTWAWFCWWAGQRNVIHLSKLLCIVLHGLSLPLSSGPVIKIAWYNIHVDYPCNGLSVIHSLLPVKTNRQLCFNRLKLLLDPQKTQQNLKDIKHFRYKSKILIFTNFIWLLSSNFLIYNARLDKNWNSN